MGPIEFQKGHLARGFDDVGYHYRVHPDGRIFEGRYLAHKGSHVKHANTGKVGILAMGDFHPGYDAGPSGGFGIDVDGDMTVTPAQESSIMMLLLFSRTVGSTGFARDEAAIRDNARRSFERGVYPRGFERQLAAVLATGKRAQALALFGRQRSSPTARSTR